MPDTQKIGVCFFRLCFWLGVHQCVCHSGNHRQGHRTIELGAVVFALKEHAAWAVEEKHRTIQQCHNGGPPQDLLPKPRWVGHVLGVLISQA